MKLNPPPLNREIRAIGFLPLIIPPPFAAAFISDSVLTAALTLFPAQPIAAAFTSDSVFSASATVIEPWAAVFTSVSTFTAQLSGQQHAEAVFASNSVLTANISVSQYLSAIFTSDSVLSASLGNTYSVEALFVAHSDLTADLRVNDEANLFVTALFTSGSNFTANASMVQALVATFESTSVMTAGMVVTVAPDFGFTIFVDVLDSAVVAAQNGRIRRYTAKLVVDGVEVPIRRAELEAAPDTLGTELRVTLARPDVSLVSLGANVTFQIGIWTGASYQYIPIITGGKLSSRDLALKNSDQRPSDEVTISIVDVVADRWNRAPRAPIHLYDPDIVDTPTQSEIAAQKIQVVHGEVILPVNVPISGMSLYSVLHEAYVTGTGFDSVTTNIPNFPVSQADFTLDGGYDAGVRSLLSLFSPLLFADQHNNLFIVDSDIPLPAGFTPRDYVKSNIIQLTDSMPRREPVNSILIHMRSMKAGDLFTERFEQEHQESGIFGTPSHTQTDIERRVREYRNDANEITREEIVQETSTTLNWQFEIMERTVRIERFDQLGRKTGYSRRSDMRLPDLMSAFIDPVTTQQVMPMALLSDVVVQDQSILYTQNPLNPNEDIQTFVMTVESGLVLVDPDNQYNQNDYKIPLLDAHRTGYISPEGGQSVEQADIKTTIEHLRVRGDQVDVETRVLNHLSDAPTRSTMTSRPGSVTINRRKQASSSRTILLTIDGTGAEGRRTPIFDAGELPGELAMELGLRRLKRLNNPPREIKIPPAFVDLSIRRGAIIRPKDRNNIALGTYIVTGYTITIEEFDSQRGIVASMAITARELTA